MVWRATTYHLLAHTFEGCCALPCTTRSIGQGRRLRSRRQRSLVFHPRLQAPVRRLPKRLAGGRKIVLVNGRIVLTLLAWLALCLARMRVWTCGFTNVSLKDLTPWSASLPANRLLGHKKFVRCAPRLFLGNGYCERNECVHEPGPEGGLTSAGVAGFHGLKYNWINKQ